MSLIKRLSTTLVTRIDRVVDELENHDAVVQAALADMQRKIAEAKVRCNRVKREMEIVKKQVVESREKAGRWRQRAIKCGREDENKALECLARAKQAEQEAARLETQGTNYSEAAIRLQDAIATLEKRLTELRQKQVLMRARESTGQALSASALSSQYSAGVVDDVLDRWEVKVLDTEMTVDTAADIDSLDQSFSDEELKRDLQEELKTLLKEENNNAC